MKTIKIEDDVHKELLKLSVLDGNRLTLSQVIRNEIKELPSPNYDCIEFDHLRGRILTCHNFRDRGDDLNSFIADMCILLDDARDESFEEFKNTENIKFGFNVDDEDYILNVYKKNDIYVDCYYNVENLYFIHLHIKNYKCHSKRK